MGLETTINNKRIAKNTIFLYFRMVLVMGVNLYTSRIILNALGINDFGIYGVIGGLVGMFSIISGSMSSAISRFLTFELGHDNNIRLKKTFGVSLSIQICLAIIIVLLCSTAGAWFLHHKMDIPASSLIAANWILVFSMLTLVVNLISVPYNAIIIAHERMNIFAYVSLLEVALKLGVAFLILLFSSNRVIIYSGALFLVAIIIRLIYGVYCNRHFSECNTRPILDRKLFKEMMGFAGWNFIGASSSILRNQGNNVILNMFFSTAVNAAYGLTMQVYNAVNQLADNFMTSVNPQITKYYAQSEFEEMNKLMKRSSILSFYLTLIITSLIFMNTPYILHLWLKEVPPYTVSFVQLIMLFTLIESISRPLITGMLATGKVRDYQIVVGGLQLLNLPLSYLALRLDATPLYPLIIAVLISVICLIARLIMLKKIIPFDGMKFLFDVCIKAFIVGGIVLGIPYLLKEGLYADKSLLNFIGESLINLLWCCGIVFFLGCDRQERKFIISAVAGAYRKIKR